LSDKPISEQQRAANRANAQRSTGPRTPEGKARSAQNARKHGFTASTFAIVRLEELDEVARLKDDLIATYQPVNSQELFAIERIALAQQTLLRAARLECGLFTQALDQALTHDDQPLVLPTDELTHDIEVTRQQNRNYALAFGFHKIARLANTWSLFMRYQAQSERMYRRAVEELERLIALRPDLPNEPISDDPVTPAVLPPVNREETEPLTPHLPPVLPEPAPYSAGSIRSTDPGFASVSTYSSPSGPCRTSRILCRSSVSSDSRRSSSIFSLKRMRSRCPVPGISPVLIDPTNTSPFHFGSLSPV
jgi:hypothetical protein